MILVMGTIFFLSHIPAASLLQPEVDNFDKVAHLAVYAILAYSMIWWLYPPENKRSPFKVACITILLCTLYGISDEYHQTFIPGRLSGFDDVIADSLGAAIISFWWLRRVLKKRQTNR